MKRLIACMLMTVVLLLSLSVPAQAQIVNVPKMQCMLWNADENWTNPGDFVLDTENQFEGTGCVSINLNGKVGTVDASVNLPDTFGVDFSIYRTLEFDIYISDFAILDHLSNTTAGGIEFGKYGVEGRLLAWSDIVSLMQHSHCLVEGWNRVVFYLKKTTSVSHTQQSSQYSTYVRIYWEGMTDCEQDWVLKFDNFVTNDGFANYEVHASGEWQHDEEDHWRNCSVCGVADKYGHYDVYAGCEEKRTCSLCSCQFEPREHSYTELVEVSPATCTQSAVCDYACRFCGQRQIQSFRDGEPLGHKESEEAVSLGECGHVYTCVGCDKNMGEMSEHDLYEWKVLREASPTENGLEKRQCVFCNYSETREIAYVAPQEPETPEQPDEPSDNGCTSVMGGAGFCVVALMLAAGVAFRKKK